MSDQETSRPTEELPFGFNGQEDFIQACEAYLVELTEEIESFNEEDLVGFNEKQHQTFKSFLESKKIKKQVLESWLSRPADFYQYVKAIYDHMIELARQGKNMREIGEVFWEKDGKRILELTTLFDYGLRQAWSYRFIQHVLSASFRNSR